MPVLNDFIESTQGLAAPQVLVGTNRFGTEHFNSEGQLLPIKTEHQQYLSHQQKLGTDCVTETVILGRFKKDSVLRYADAILATMPDGGDKTVKVKFQKSAWSGGANQAFADCSTEVTFADADNTPRTTKACTITTATFEANSILAVVITVAGSTGTQGQGLLAQAVVDVRGAA